MMLSPTMIKTLLANMQLVIRDEHHFNHIMDGLGNAVNDKHIDGSFDCFGFAWGLLPQWARVLLLSVAYRENKQAFEGVRPSTPIVFFTEQQRYSLSVACEKLLTSIVTLHADYDFTHDYYKSFVNARREALSKHYPQEKAA